MKYVALSIAIVLLSCSATCAGWYRYNYNYNYNYGYGGGPSVSDAIVNDTLNQPRRMLMHNYYRQARPPVVPYRYPPAYGRYYWGW